MSAFIPDAPELWFRDLRPGVRRARWGALCKLCMEKNLKANGRLVEEKFMAAMVVDRQQTEKPLQ